MRHLNSSLTGRKWLYVNLEGARLVRVVHDERAIGRETWRPFVRGCRNHGTSCRVAAAHVAVVDVTRVRLRFQICADHERAMIGHPASIADGAPKLLFRQDDPLRLPS